MDASNTLIEKILSDYLAEKNLLPAAEALLQEFAQYATKWLTDVGIVGVGHNPVGLSLRVKNGDEFLFFKPLDAFVEMRGAAVGITGGTTTGVKNNYVLDTKSLPISGQHK